MGIFQVSPSFIAVAVGSEIKVFSKTENVNFSCICEESSNDKTVDFALFSKSFQYFAALFSDKNLVVWSTGSADDKSWKKLCVKTVNRRSTSLAFSPEEDSIYAADKSGDLCCFPIQGSDTDDSKNIEPVLGHVSILLDVSVTNLYIITADRDEKIRISRRDRPYVIESFCLGHTEFVCRVQPLGGDSDKLASTSGDGTLRVWQLSSGELLQSFNVAEKKVVTAENNNDDVAQLVPSLLSYCAKINLLAVACPGNLNSKINIFNVSDLGVLTESYVIVMPKNTQLLDITFDSCTNTDQSVILYALVKTDENVSVSAFSCSAGGYNNSDSLDNVNKYLREHSHLDLGNIHCNDLFKNTVPGHVYESFYKNKENNFKNQKKSAKRRRLL